MTMTFGTRAGVRRLLALAGAAALALAGCGGDGGPDQPPTVAGEAPPFADAALAAIDVEEAWRWEAPPPGSVGMPGVDGDGVAVTYGHLRLVLLDLGGDERWEAERIGLRDVAPALAPDVVVAATEQGVMAVDRDTGRIRWDATVGERANAPVLVGDRAVVSTWEGSLTAFDLADGRVAWRAGLPGPAIGPAASDGTSVVVSWESKQGDAAGVVAVDGVDGRRLWAVALEPGGVGGPAIVAVPRPPSGGAAGAAGPLVVLVAGDMAAHGLDLADGTERWRTGTDGRGSPEVPPLPLAGGEVLVAHRLAGLDLLDAVDGEAQWGGAAGGVAVRGGPAGTGPDGPFAFPTDDGRLMLVGPGWQPRALDWPGRISGVAQAPGGLFLVATREAKANHLIAIELATGG